MKFSIKDFFRKCPADFVTCTEKISFIQNFTFYAVQYAGPDSFMKKFAY